jgi:hypothetical protein
MTSAGSRPISMSKAARLVFDRRARASGFDFLESYPIRLRRAARRAPGFLGFHTARQGAVVRASSFPLGSRSRRERRPPSATSSFGYKLGRLVRRRSDGSGFCAFVRQMSFPRTGVRRNIAVTCTLDNPVASAQSTGVAAQNLRGPVNDAAVYLTPSRVRCIEVSALFQRGIVQWNLQRPTWG